jgi:alpha-L-arabinofuranosidase
MKKLLAALPLFALAGAAAAQVAGDAPPAPRTASLEIRLDQPAKPISPDLFGIFFEDLNDAADGGLYAELVRNRSFEFSATEQPTWNLLTGWELVARGGGRGSLEVDGGRPLHANNPHYAVLNAERLGEGVGIVNAGYGGIVLKKGAAYNASLWVRKLYNQRRWGGPPLRADQQNAVIVRLESADGKLLGETRLEFVGTDWAHVAGPITAADADDDARLLVLAAEPGGLALDIVSLFPQDTFRGRPNGFRRDLAETIAALEPRFVRFPGGCLVHGDGVPNFYRWQDTVGPLHERREQKNLWGYHQSVGLGYFEFFQFCEDLGAKPLPVVPAGVSCQHSGHTQGTGQSCVPRDDMPAYIESVLALIEWANGPADSRWGAVRAAAGHPEPFGLEYLAVGNEDAQTPEFRERFRMIYDAIRAKHPEITVIGTVGPFADGEDFDAGWKFADELQLPMVDEHYYQEPQWFVDNLRRYDGYDRAKSKVYLGEYASRGSTLDNALAEAAYMTGLERNGDVVQFASYAPLLGKLGRTQWNPDLIYFTNTSVVPTVNYYVQQMFGANQGDASPPQSFAVEGEFGRGECVAASAVVDAESGDLIIKLVNKTPEAVTTAIKVAGAASFAPAAVRTILAGDPRATNDREHPRRIVPQTEEFAVAEDFELESPAFSCTVLRLRRAAK